MTDSPPIQGVYLSDTLDLQELYGPALTAAGSDVEILRPDEVTDPAAIRFAICWLSGDHAFGRYPNLELAMSIGAGVDDLLAHPSLAKGIQIARVRDPHQADLMAGYAAHEVLHVTRQFGALEASAALGNWAPIPMTPPCETVIAVLGNGTMGQAVTNALRQLGFSLRVGCRTEPAQKADGVVYCTGPEAAIRAATDAHILINILPLTTATENVLNADLFSRLAPGAWLVQIGRGENLVEADMMAALDAGQLAGATLDVFRDEPLPRDHPYWKDGRLRLTPHIASDSMPAAVAQQVVDTARELRDGLPLTLGVDRKRGY